ncbi:MAG TPA: tripartite tricarboxylate transporter substrate binding protein [Bordetella sp.]
MRKSLAAISLAIAGTLSMFHAACRAQDYPARQVRLEVGFPPGGGNDLLARLLGAELERALGQPFIVENRPGAQGFIAFNTVKTANPDGYTLLIGPSSGMTVNPEVYRTLPYDAIKDFAPISLIGAFPLIVTAAPKAPFGTLKALISAAKSQPGTINYASAASSFQLATEMFAQQAGINLHNIPYKGSAQSVQAVMGNQVPLTFADSAAVIAEIKSGALRALAVTSKTRVPTLPEVPTVAEAGLPGYEMVLWSGLFAPAGTPRDIVDTLQRAVAQAIHAPQMQEKLQLLGVMPVGSTADELADTMQRQISEYTRVAKTANITVD